MWATLAYIGATWAISQLLSELTPKERIKKLSQKEFEHPRNEDAPWPLVWGTVKIDSPNTIWTGDYQSLSLHTVDPTDWHYYYLMTVALGVCLSNDTTSGAVLLDIWFDDNHVWHDNWFAEGPVIDDSEYHTLRAFGPRGSYGGKFYWHNGSTIQIEDPFLVTAYTDENAADPDMPDATLLPAYRGIAYIVFGDVALGRVGVPDPEGGGPLSNGGYANDFGGFAWGEVGKISSLPKIALRVRNLSDNLGLGSILYNPLVSGDINHVSANPAEVLYDVLTNTWGRLGLDTSLIDTASFAAEGAVLAGEGNGMDAVLYDVTSVDSFIEEIVKQIDGVLYEDAATRTIKLKLVREDYDVDTIPHFTDDDLGEEGITSYETGSWEDLYNEVRGNFTWRYNGKEETVVQRNFVGGETRRTFNISFPHVSDARLAQILTAREMRALGAPLSKATVSLGRRAATLSPGDVFKWSSTTYNFANKVMRVATVDRGSLTDGRVTVACVQDAFSVTSESGQSVLPTPPVAPNFDPACILTKEILELPRHLAVAASIADPESSRLMVLAKRPASADSFAAYLYSEDGTVINAQLMHGANFVHTAVVATDYARTTEEYDQTVGIELTSLTATLKTSTTTQIRAMGRNMILVVTPTGEQEFIAYASFTGNTIEDVWRGLLDTAAINIPAGSVLYFLPDFSYLGGQVVLTTTWAGDEALVLQLPTKNAWVTADVADAEKHEHTMAHRALCPYPPQLFTLDGSNDPGEIITPEVAAAWLRRTKLSPFVIRSLGADDPETGVTYIIRGSNTEAYAPADEATIDAGVDGVGVDLTLAELGHGLIDVTAVATQYNSDLAEDLEAFNSPVVSADLKRWRQLLINNDFTHATAGYGWTFSIGSYALGSYAQASGLGGTADAWLAEQDVSVAAWAPDGLVARLRFKTKIDALSTTTVVVRAYDASNNLLDTATTGALSSASTVWDHRELSLTMPAGTSYIRVAASSSGGEGSAPIVGYFDLRFGDQSAQLLLNTDFTTDTTSWTAAVGTNGVATGYGFGDSGNGLYISGDVSDETEQKVSLDQTGYHRGTALLFFDHVNNAEIGPPFIIDTAEVHLVSLTSADAVIDSVSVTVSSSGWAGKVLALDIDLNTVAKLQVRVISTVDNGGDNDCLFDNFGLYVHRELYPVHNFEDGSLQEPTAQVFPTAGPTCPAASQDYVWHFQDAAASLAALENLNADGAAFVVDATVRQGVTVTGLNDSVLGMNGRLGIESHGATSVGHGAVVTSTTIGDVGTDSFAMDITFKSAETPADIRSVVEKRLTGAGAGWELVQTATGGLTFTVEDTGGSSLSVNATQRYTDSALHKARIVVDRSAHVAIIYTDLETSATVDVTGYDLTAAAAFLALFGAGQRDRPESFLITCIEIWTGAAAVARNSQASFDASWTHGDDPSGLAMVHDVTAPVATMVGSGTTGDVWSAYAAGQAAIATNGNIWGAAKFDDQANLVNPDPNSADWTWISLPLSGAGAAAGVATTTAAAGLVAAGAGAAAGVATTTATAALDGDAWSYARAGMTIPIDNTSFVDIHPLGFTMEANATYMIEGELTVTSDDDAGTSQNFQITPNGPASPALVAFHSITMTGVANTSRHSLLRSYGSAPSMPTDVGTTTGDRIPMRFNALITNGTTAGRCVLQLRVETGSGVYVYVQPQSVLRYLKVS